jgi:hypothetical protein
MSDFRDSAAEEPRSEVAIVMALLYVGEQLERIADRAEACEAADGTLAVQAVVQR